MSQDRSRFHAPTLLAIVVVAVIIAAVAYAIVSAAMGMLS